MQNQNFPANPRQAVERHDIYRGIHKALRSFMSDTMIAVGRTDAADEAEVGETLARLKSLLAICRLHLVDENQFIHPALESRRPGSSAKIADEHVHHTDSFAEIEQLAREVERSIGGQREAALLALYHRLSLFVADNFVHMHAEETRHNTILWATHSDGELQAIEGAIVASIPPQEMMIALRWMVPAMNAAERAALLGGMRASAPPAVFDAVMDAVRPHLGSRDRAKLALALAPAPERAAA